MLKVLCCAQVESGADGGAQHRKGTVWRESCRLPAGTPSPVGNSSVLLLFYVIMALVRLKIPKIDCPKFLPTTS